MYRRFLSFACGLCWFLCLTNSLRAQELDSLRPAQVLTLKDVVELAKRQSPAYYQISNYKESQFWAYRAFKANYLPQLVLSGVLPNYTKSITQVQQPDGSLEPRFVNLTNNSLALSLNQNIGLTGGSLFASTQLARVDNFVTSERFYNSSPIVIGINQPLFQFNALYWNKQIAPLQYEESRRQYLETLEDISVNTTALFFDLLLAQISLEIAQKNRANNDTIYKIAQGRYNLGKIGEDELLQLELTLKRAEQGVSQARLDVETATLKLKSNIGLLDNQRIQLIPPTNIPAFLVDEATALSEARKNRSDVITFRRNLLEAQRDVAQAKRETGLNGTLSARLGLSSQATTIPEVYRSPDNQQIISMNFSIPILDWGEARARRKTAQASFERTKNIVAQNEVNFDQQVYTQIKQFEMLREQLVITGKSDEIGQKRYDISKNRYLIGKIGITDLNIALTEKDQAKQSYIQSLRNFWTAYYNVRKLTLYDFETNSVISLID